MNLHLFLDVVAWFFGVLMSLNFIANRIRAHEVIGDLNTAKEWRKAGWRKSNDLTAWLSFTFATLCWAWTVEGGNERR